MAEDCNEADDAEVIVRWDVSFSSLIPLDKEVVRLMPNEFSQIMNFSLRTIKKYLNMNF